MNEEIKKEENNTEDKGHDRRHEKRTDRCQRDCCHNGGGSVLGLMLVFSGLILVLNFLGLASWNIWHIMLDGWPVLLVIMGISLIFGRNIVGRIITSILAFIIFSLILIYGLLKIDSPALKYIPQGAVNYVQNMTSAGKCSGGYCRINSESKDEFLQN